MWRQEEGVWFSGTEVTQLITSIETKPRSSWRATEALNRWVISPAPETHYLCLQFIVCHPCFPMAALTFQLVLELWFILNLLYKVKRRDVDCFYFWCRALFCTLAIFVQCTDLLPLFVFEWVYFYYFWIFWSIPLFYSTIFVLLPCLHCQMDGYLQLGSSCLVALISCLLCFNINARSFSVSVNNVSGLWWELDNFFKSCHSKST